MKNYWRRLVMVVGLYVEGVKSESIQGVTTTMDEYLWRRVMSGRQWDIKQNSCKNKEKNILEQRDRGLKGVQQAPPSPS